MNRLVALLMVLASLGCRSKSTPQPAPDPAPSLPPKPKVPRVFASGQDHPWGVYVDATYVWWSNKGKHTEGAIFRKPKNGGDIAKVASARRPYAIAPFGRWVHWSDATPVAGGIGHAIPGSGATTVTKHCPKVSIEEPWSLVIAGDRIYWTDLHARNVASAAVKDRELTVAEPEVDCATARVHATTTGRPVGLAVDGTHVYWTDSDPGIVARAPIEGGPEQDLVVGGDKTTGLAIDDAHVYWSEWGSGRIGKVAKNGGGIVALASDQKGARAIAVDAQRVYFTHPPSGSIRSVSKSGGEVVTHATDQKHPYSIAVDDTSIYWVNVDGDTVMAVDK